MEEFCNGSEIWDVKETWNSGWPQFTECFQNTVLIWVASGWVWMTAPMYLWYLCTVTGNSLVTSWNFTFKSVMLVLQVILCVIKMVNAVNDLQPEGHYIRASLVGPIIEAATLILVLTIVILEKRCGFITSGVLFIYWTLALITKIIPFYSKIILKEYEENLSTFVWFNGYFGLTLVQFILSCFAEQYPDTDSKVCPELKASFLSRTTFWWMNKMMIQGYKSPITEDDLFKLRPWDESKTVVPRFEKKWYDERLSLQSMFKMKHIKPPEKINVNIQESTEETPLLQGEPISEETKVAYVTKKPSLIKVLFKTFGLELLHANVYKLFYDLLLFVSPILLQYLMMFTNDKNFGGTFHEMWKGYVLAAALFVTAMIQSVLYQQLYHWSTTVELRVRASLISAVYKKALRINCKAKNESTVGEIVNLVSVDVEHVEEVVTYLSYLWSIPLQVAISMYFISRLVGISVIYGVLSLFVLLLLNFIAIYLMQKYETKEMEQKDIRMKVFNEVLNGIKSLKLYAWEMTFKEKIEAIRNVELDILWNINLFESISDIVWSIAPFVVAFATFTSYVYSDKSDHFLTANTVFVSISLFNILNFAMNVTPSVVIETIKAAVSLRRLQKFLNRDELDDNNVLHNNDVDSGDAIIINNGNFLWDEELGCCLSNIHIRIPEGSLVAVVGQVGSGKSSLVSAILGEMIKVKGYVIVKGSTAYVPQQAWIQNATLRDNILFGRSMSNGKYNEIVEACALQPDLEMLPAGDMTEIGEKGINLSGGQKQRVSLARAVYYDSDIYLLDDPLSAVDFHVGKHIFDKVLSRKGILKSKTRLLVTHGIHWLPYVDTIIVLNNGRVSEVGSYDELLDHAGAFANYLQTYFLHCEDEETEQDSELYQVRAEIRQRLTSVTSEDGTRAYGFEDNTQSNSSEAAKIPMYKCESRDDEEESLSDIDDQLIEEESVMTGRVKYGVYKSYAKAIGTPYVIMLFVLLGVYHTCTMMANIWLSYWTEDKTLNNRTFSPGSSVYRERNYYYTGIYGAWGVGQGLSVALYVFLMIKRTIKASKNLHEGMLHSIVRSPMSFFDTTPAGRIVNRFSLDIETIDNELPIAFENSIDAFLCLITTLIVISYSTPIFMVAVVPLGILYFTVQRFYITTSRQLKRIESKTNSPIYSHFGETLNGVSVIKAFNEQERFLNELETRVDNNQRVAFASYSADRWLGFWLEFVGNIVILAASLLAVLSRDSISASVVGLSISYALEITENLSWFVEMMSDLETKIVSVERVREYTEIPQEDALIYKNHRPPPTWPSEGVVRFNNYFTRYRPGLDLVLKGIDATINSGEKVGIVGRTGAGKSSLTLALFRLIEPVNGSIIIDDENICHMGLHDCRSRLTILPQDPILFSGTVRTNIDPLGEHCDDQIWRALDHAHLKTYIESLPTNLDYECGEEGQNFSVGQKQLLCLARSLLRKTKILILDEATAAVDMETDDLIQQTIRSEFKECTVLTIAHRLNTIMDYDRIMVLDQGEIQEFDSPDNLLKRSGSIFYQLAKDAGISRQTN